MDREVRAAMRSLVATGFLLCASLVSTAQTSVPPNSGQRVGYPFKNASILKPPAGAKVAIYEFEDMECPVCAGDFSAVRAAVLQYKVPLARRDFPLTEIHVWSFDAAVTARYIQDSISQGLAEEFRHDVFANQQSIDSKDDLVAFTRRWFQAHHQNLPFVMDASGACKDEVKSDRALGDRIGIRGTPCVFVVTRTSWTLVSDISQLNRTIQLALAQTSTPTGSAAPRPRPAAIHR
jgi:protein-disulfide isomerase